MPKDAHACPSTSGKDRVLKEDELGGKHLPSKPVVPTAARAGPSPPQGCCLYPGFPGPPVPTSRPPQVDSPSAFPPFPQPVHLAQVSFVIPAFNSNFTLDLELNQ